MTQTSSTLHLVQSQSWECQWQWYWGWSHWLSDGWWWEWMVIIMDGDENGWHEHKWTHIDTSFEAISMKVMMIVMVIMIMAVMMMVMMTMIMLVKTIIVTVSTSVLKKTKQPPKVWLCHHSSSHPCPPFFLSTALLSSTSTSSHPCPPSFFQLLCALQLLISSDV